MNKIVLDTNYILALLDSNDVHHMSAKRIEEKLENRFIHLIYLDCVISEVISIIIKRLKEKKKDRLIVGLILKIQEMVPKEKITWVYPNIEAYYNSVIQTIKDYDGLLNFNDALILNVAKKYGITHIISFDKGFDETGLIRIKDAEDI